MGTFSNSEAYSTTVFAGGIYSINKRSNIWIHLHNLESTIYSPKWFAIVSLLPLLYGCRHRRHYGVQDKQKSNWRERFHLDANKCKTINGIKKNIILLKVNLPYLKLQCSWSLFFSRETDTKKLYGFRCRIKQDRKLYPFMPNESYQTLIENSVVHCAICTMTPYLLFADVRATTGKVKTNDIWLAWMCSARCFYGWTTLALWNVIKL